MASPLKRKRVSHSIEFKMRILQEVDSKKKRKTEICKEHGIAPSTLSGFIKQRTSIEEAYQKRQVDESRLKIEACLFAWFKQALAGGLPVSGPILAKKATAIDEELGLVFSPNNNWLQRFKERNSITFKAVCGEEGSVKDETKCLLHQCGQRPSAHDTYFRLIQLHGPPARVRGL